MVKNQLASAGDITDANLIPESERSPGGGHGKPLQYFCLKVPLDRGVWWCSPWGHKELDTTEVTYHALTLIFND